MARELDPRAVEARLAALRALYVAETVEQGGLRLAREQPRARESPDQIAARSLAELRALCELARALHACRSRNAGSIR